MFDSLLDALGGQWWAYPLILGLCVVDAIFPVLPSETALITGGLVAADGGMNVWLVVMMGAVGAFAGDNLAYTIGASAQDRVHRWVLRGEKGRRRLEWTNRNLRRYGGTLVIVARFIPGGRTATTLGCGALGYPRRQFVAFDAVGAVTWSTVSTLLGYLGGRAFSDNALLAFGVSVGVAVVVAGLIEAIRRLAAWRRVRTTRTRTG